MSTKNIKGLKMEELKTLIRLVHAYEKDIELNGLSISTGDTINTLYSCIYKNILHSENLYDVSDIEELSKIVDDLSTIGVDCSINSKGDICLTVLAPRKSERMSKKMIRYQAPTNHIINNTRAMTELFMPKNRNNIQKWTMLEKENYKGQPIDISNNKSKVNIFVKCRKLREYPNNEFSQVLGLTIFDRCVYDCLCAIVENNPEIVRNKETEHLIPLRSLRSLVFRGEVKPSSKNLKRVKDSLIKMSDLWVELDVTNHPKKKYSLDYEEFKRDKIEARLVNVSFVTGRDGYGHNNVEGIKILEFPPLYRYSKGVGQIATIPIKPRTTAIKPQTDLMQVEYLITCRIPQAQNTKGVNKISINSIYQAFVQTETGTEGLENILSPEELKEKMVTDPEGLLELRVKNLDKREKSRIRKRTELIFEDLKSIGYIKSYEVNKKGRSVTGYTFTVK